MLISLLQLGLTAGLTYNLRKNLIKRVLLRDEAALGDGVLENLTLAIPVRNELANLKVLLPQLVDLRIRPKRLLILNDGSTDGSAELLQSFVEKYSWIEIIKGSELPTGWRGKVWALQQLVRETQTSDVMFMDADLRIKSPFALGILYDEFKKRGARGFFSVFPKIVGPIGARILTDQVSFHLNYFLPFNAEKLPTKSAVAATGQIMLGRVKEFVELNSFARIRSSTHDGLKLARIYAGSGLPVVTFDGQNLFECEMYQSFSDSFKGFSRNALEAYGNNKMVIAAMSALVFWLFVLPYFIWPLMMADPAFLMSFLLVLLGQLYLAKEYKMGVTSFVLAPFKGAATIAVNGWSVGSKVLGLKSEWKGRMLSHENTKSIS